MFVTIGCDCFLAENSKSIPGVHCVFKCRCFFSSLAPTYCSFNPIFPLQRAIKTQNFPFIVPRFCSESREFPSWTEICHVVFLLFSANHEPASIRLDSCGSQSPRMSPVCFIPIFILQVFFLTAPAATTLSSSFLAVSWLAEAASCFSSQFCFAPSQAYLKSLLLRSSCQCQISSKTTMKLVSSRAIQPN